MIGGYGRYVGGATGGATVAAGARYVGGRKEALQVRQVQQAAVEEHRKDVWLVEGDNGLTRHKPTGNGGPDTWPMVVSVRGEVVRQV